MKSKSYLSWGVQSLTLFYRDKETNNFTEDCLLGACRDPNFFV